MKKTMVGVGGLALCATLTFAAFGDEGTDAPKGTVRAACEACLSVCQVPLDYDDSLLDDSTDHYLSAAAREIATTAAIDMARKLTAIDGEHQTGHFGRAYAANAAAIARLAKKQARDGADSGEIEALKRARTALYADAVVALQAGAADPHSTRLATAYRARAAVLGGVISSMAARQQMRAAERLAVCEVLAAYKSE